MSQEKSKRTRRTPDQLIAELENRIAQVKERQARQKTRRDPTLRHIAGALRSIDKALAVSEDSATRSALGEARTTLSAVLALNGVEDKKLGGKPVSRNGSVSKVEPERVMEYLLEHPGSRGEEMASGMGSETAAIRPALQKLRAEGRVRTEGQRRAMRYFPADAD